MFLLHTPVHFLPFFDFHNQLASTSVILEKADMELC